MKKVFTTLSLFLLMGGFAHASEYSFTMEEAVKQSLLANPSLKQAEKTVEAADSQVNVARAAFGPSAQVGYDYSKSLTFGDREAASISVGLTQPLFTGFQTLNTLQKQALEADYQRLSLEKQNIAIANSVQLSFLGYLQAEESIISAQKSISRAQEQLDIARSGYNLGLRPQIDVLQAQLDLSLAEATLIENENKRENFRATLNSLLNIPVEAQTKYVGSLEKIHLSITFADAVKKAFSQSPDLLMAQKSLAKAEKDLDIVQGNWFPRVSASLGWTSQGDNWRANGGQLVQNMPERTLAGDAQDTRVGLSAEWTIFNSGSRYYSVKSADSNVQALTHAVENVHNNVALQVKNNLLSLQDSLRMIDVAERSYISAEKSFFDAKTRYENQLGTNLEMLTAQSDLADAELSLISAKAGYLIGLSNFYQSIGEIHPSLTAE